jgi:kynurenine formamidase
VRVPLWQELSAATPLFPGDPPFEHDIVTTIPESGYLLERVTSLGTHTGTHISAPAHFVRDAPAVSQLDEGWTLMPLVVLDVRSRVAADGGDFQVDVAALRRFERRGITGVGSDTFGPDASSDADFSATATALQHGGITVENVGPGLARMRPFGDWVSVNGARPRFSGFPMGITGFTLA